jgi:hypothetical protein
MKHCPCGHDVFQLKPTTHVPVHHIGFSSKSASLILGRQAYVGGGIQQYRESLAIWQGADEHAEFVARSQRDAIDLALATGQDLIRASYWRMKEKPAKRLDEFTFLYGNPDGDYRIMRLEPETELYQLVDQSSSAPLSYDLLEEDIRTQESTIANYNPDASMFSDTVNAMRLHPDHAIRAGGASLHIPYEPAIWLEATLERPDLVERKLDLDVQYARKHIDLAGRLGIKYLFGGGDFATNQGPMYSPHTFHDLMLPRLKIICDTCHRHGIKYLFGTDGNVWPVADDLFGASGVDGFYEVDVKAGMDLYRLRDRFPKLVIVGNIASHTLHAGTPDEVHVETLAMMQAARELRGIFVGCSNQVVSQTPPENLDAMLAALREQNSCCNVAR